jgi:hypothetical protein
VPTGNGRKLLVFEGGHARLTANGRGHRRSSRPAVRPEPGVQKQASVGRSPASKQELVSAEASRSMAQSAARRARGRQQDRSRANRGGSMEHGSIYRRGRTPHEIVRKSRTSRIAGTNSAPTRKLRRKSGPGLPESAGRRFSVTMDSELLPSSDDHRDQSGASASRCRHPTGMRNSRT